LANTPLGRHGFLKGALKLIIGWVDANRACIFQEMLDIPFLFASPGAIFVFNAFGLLRHGVAHRPDAARSSEIGGSASGTPGDSAAVRSKDGLYVVRPAAADR
jgi:hypothetical protein